MASETFLPQETIRRKRDGQTLSEAEIAELVATLADGRLTEGQAAAFAMAVFFRGMTDEECAAMTRAMTASGSRLEWRGLDRPVLDKHSTGGIGDKVSLILAPAVAACGGAVPMISGRGLGHTGGTLDKLESIPGYDAAPGLERLARVVREVGCAIVGQTAELAPADRRLYAIRDVTATVESAPLIVASILSKKLAEGLDGLAMDVKVGSGAFMRGLPAARELAARLVRVAEQAGLPTVALVTDMDQPLGRAAGNALEVREAIAQLTGAGGEARLRMVTEALAAEMLELGGLAETPEAAHRRIEQTLVSGAAAETFQRMVAALGGPADLVERPNVYLPAAPVVRPVRPTEPGIVQRIDARALGLAVVKLGGGRRRTEDRVDPAVGLADIAGVGERVDGERPLAVVHARDEAAADAAAGRLRAAYVLGEGAARPQPLIAARLPDRP